MLTIYKASAGSGKTYTLAYEFIKILLGLKREDGSYVLNHGHCLGGAHRHTNRHRGILAITFTNAATAEMKGRIIRELNALIELPEKDGGKDAPYAARLCSDYGCGREDLRQAASMALRELLIDYSTFNVSTIDSFFQSVLRTFSREIDHQGDYELQLDRMDVIKQSVSLMLDDLNYGERKGPLFDWVRSYMYSLISDGRNFNIFDRGGKILGSLARGIDRSMDEEYYKYAHDISEYVADPRRGATFIAALDSRISTACAQVCNLANDIFRAMERYGVRPEDFAVGTYPRLVLARDSSRNLPREFFNVAPIKNLLADGTPVPVAKIFPARSLKPLEKSTPGIGENFAAMFTGLYSAALDARAVSSIYRRFIDATRRNEFLGYASEFMERLLKDNNMMLISDTGDLLRRIISEAEMPFIYERLGMRLTNLLIDEFQDTSRMQWHNLRPLVGNSLAGGHDNLIIGDEKQAIYRFRNSDPELLGTQVAGHDFPDNHILRGSDPADNTNYRSSGAIVRFNNTVFTRLAAGLGARGYGNVVQTPAEHLAEQPAYICAYNTKGWTEEEIFSRIASQIASQHSAGYHWRDILVLVRTRNEGVRLIEYLQTHHPEIRLLSNDSLLLNNSPAIRMIISMLRLAERSYIEDARKTAEAENSSGTRYANREDIAMMICRYDYHCGKGISAESALGTALAESEAGAQSFIDEIKSVRAENPANIVALIEAVIHHKLTDAQRTSEHAYISALQDLALAHAESADPSLSAFLAAYDRRVNTLAIQAPASLDAVEVMTIHASKGLERACVHMPFVSWKYNDSTEIWLEPGHIEGISDADIPPMLRIEVSKDDALLNPRYSQWTGPCAEAQKAEMQDNVNLTYVAFTRASRELTLYIQPAGIGVPVLEAIQMCGSDSSTMMDTAAYIVNDDDGERFIYGKPTCPENAQKSADNIFAAGPYKVVYRPDIRGLVSIEDIFSESKCDIGNEQANEIVDSDRRSAAMREAARRGNNLHMILADMTTRSDLDNAIQRVATRLGLSESETAGYRDELEAAFDAGGDTVAAWFAPEAEIFAERAIYVPQYDVSFRPDRVVRLADGRMAVIDYKFTGEEKPSHKRQVRNYARLTERIEHCAVEAYLWYPSLRRIVCVDTGMTDE